MPTDSPRLARKLVVQSVPEQGSVFRLELPAD